MQTARSKGGILARGKELDGMREREREKGREVEEERMCYSLQYSTEKGYEIFVKP